MDTALIGAVTAILIVAWAIYAMGALKLNKAVIEAINAAIETISEPMSTLYKT